MHAQYWSQMNFTLKNNISGVGERKFLNASPEPGRVQVHFPRMTRKFQKSHKHSGRPAGNMDDAFPITDDSEYYSEFYSFAKGIRNLCSDREYGIISSVNRKSKQSKVDWYGRCNKESGSDYPHSRLLRVVNCQTLGDEPLYSMFDRTNNENGNNINNNPNNCDTSNSNTNINENGCEIIINRGIIYTLQSQLSELYNSTWQYIMKSQFKSKIASINPTISDITINTCYQLYDNPTKINECVLSIARQIKEKTITITSSLGTQYLTLPESQEVSIVKAFMIADLPNELIELLERIVFSNNHDGHDLEKICCNINASHTTVTLGLFVDIIKVHHVELMVQKMVIIEDLVIYEC